jgi:hypothetical protein
MVGGFSFGATTDDGKKKDLTELFFFTKFQYKLTVCINLNGERGPNP